MKKITTILSIVLLSVSFNGNAQISVTSGQPITDYVTNHLLGLGVTVSNVTFTGDPAQIGYFDGTGVAGFGFADGTVISSGGVTNLVPGNFGTDDFSMNTNADLVAVAQSVTTNPAASNINDANDVGILEFDFVPESDLVSFNFIFGSNEYEYWINSQYNDAFGFFVSGPGITGPYSAPAGFPGGSQNLALVPGTNLPITISTIYPANAASGAASNPAGLNPQFYVDNSSNTNVQLNGYTVPMNITFSVTCGETYHFKFAVADMQDQSLSTVVFLEAGSFTSPPINLSLSNTTGGGSDTIIEACSDARFVLARSICQSLYDLTINFTTSGTATNGVDYNIAQPSPLFMPAGQDTIYLDFSTIADALVEGTETVTINIDYVDQYGNPQTSSATFYLSDITPLGINETDLSLACFDDEVILTAVGTGGSGTYVYDWVSGSSTTTQDTVSILQNGVTNYVVSITDACLGTYTDTVTVTMNQTLVIDTMIAYTASACTPDGAVSGLGAGMTGIPQYHWEGPGTGGPSQINASVMQNLSPGWYVFTVTDNVCSVTDSIFLNSEPGPIADMTLSTISGCNPTTVTFTNNSQNATTYEWYFGNGNSVTVTDLSSQTQTFTVSADQALIAINGPCRDTAFASVLIVECGCTDPQATNYNPNAVQNDGSCIFPEPSVIVPNIFTPNGDKNNDVFKLTTVNATEIEIKINNRWGNNVYVGTGLDAAWDGKIDGTLAPDGVYFVQYTVKGLMGREITGQGFLQLIR
ncbi:choice-of-anchor L domain-containing protein [Fluviicola sp.]|uniref:choice-of-anchor L domain-containing protein n=1 Tax=Fluviicola sp. TaxID=1917219 RepID=UPI0031E1BB3C